MPDKTISVGVVMDQIEGITPKKDSTLAMLLEAERRGADIHYMLQGDLRLDSGVARASSRLLHVRDDSDNWFELGSEQTIGLGDLDVVLMRKDPPFDMEYIYTSYILDRAEEAGSLVVNRPQALRDMNEKAYTAWFADCSPAALITSKNSVFIAPPTAWKKWAENRKGARRGRRYTSKVWANCRRWL